MATLIDCSADDARKVMVLFAASRFTGTETSKTPDINPADAPMAVDGGLMVGEAYHADLTALASADDLQAQYDAWAVSDLPTSSKTLAMAALTAEFGTLLNQLRGNLTPDQKDTRRSEDAWSKAYLANGDTFAAARLVTSLTPDERAEHGDGAADYMAQKIARKARRDDELRSQAIGVRRTVEKMIEAATTDAEITAALAKGRVIATAAVAAALAAQG